MKKMLSIVGLLFIMTTTPRVLHAQDKTFIPTETIPTGTEEHSGKEIIRSFSAKRYNGFYSYLNGFTYRVSDGVYAITRSSNNDLATNVFFHPDGAPDTEWKNIKEISCNVKQLHGMPANKDLIITNGTYAVQLTIKDRTATAFIPPIGTMLASK